MRSFWVKKCIRDHLRSIWQSFVLVKLRRWQRSAAAEERWGSLTKLRLWSPWRSIVSMTVRPASSSWSSEKWSQYPDSKSWSVLKWRPSTDRCTFDGPSYLPSMVMKKSSRRNCTSMVRRSPWQSVVTMTIRREVHRPSRVLADFQQIESLFN